jgi:hypothetical protein
MVCCAAIRALLNQVIITDFQLKRTPLLQAWPAGHVTESKLKTTTV